ncbi:hypothetical protein Lser_V15G37191 [Lactuca serriola]
MLIELRAWLKQGIWIPLVHLNNFRGEWKLSFITKRS